MLAQKADAPFDSDQHLFEIKWDGIRCLAFVEPCRFRLQSREEVDITAQFPELASLVQLPPGTVLDGELVIMQDGKPSLAGIQRRVHLLNPGRIEHLSQTAPALYVVFDLLYCRGTSVMATPLTDRRGMLENLVAEFSPANLLVPKSIPRSGCALFDQVIALGLEGIVAKRKDGLYRMGKRSRAWLKIKPANSPGSSFFGMESGSRRRKSS
jgi:bifunctional non-homologous end joining protein LigD